MTASLAAPRIGILIFDEVEELDFVGPYEVFGMTRKIREMQGTADLGEVVLIGLDAQPVRAFNGLRILPDTTIAEVEALDVLLVPGGFGTRPLMGHEGLKTWLRKVAPTCTWVTSVCTGSMLLAAAGLAEGRKVTTHWSMVEEFRGLNLGCTVTEGSRFQVDGNLVSSAGVSAGIDMALWLVGQIHGIPQARATQRFMQYEPEPPYADAA
ncbi:DJ-1/PfpI family protein [Zavarzinia sp. CC-PAN008]|uniref:DJ-1/PfpI family protein n=1 Tax=Zavarzinia sp. CC-PAN008 TaxID=3243332 RepID=UPI003F74A892